MPRTMKKSKKDLTFYEAQRLYNLPRLGDADHDGVLNMWDCHPYDPNRDGIFGRALNVVTGGKYGQSKEDYTTEKVEKQQLKIEREQAKLDKENEKMPRTPVYGPEDEYHSPKDTGEDDYERMLKSKKQTRKLGTGESVLLYISTGIGRYELVDKTFDSKIEARQFADENYHKTPIKALTQSEAVAEAKKQQARAERLTKAKERIISGAKATVSGAKIVGRGSVAAVRRGAEKAHDYSERREKAEVNRLEKQEEAEERALVREARELERGRIRLQREKLGLQREQQLHTLKAERESLRLKRPTTPNYPESQSSRLQMPNVWAQTQRTTIVGPTSRGSLNPPPPMTSKTPWVPRNSPPPIRMSMPNIWQRQYSRPAPQPRARHIKKQKPKKMKRRR